MRLLLILLLVRGMASPLLAQEAAEREVAEVTELVEARETPTEETAPAPPETETGASENGIAEMTAIMEEIDTRPRSFSRSPLPDEAAEDESEAPDRGPPGVAGPDKRVEALVKELSRKQDELDKANAEVMRLRAMVKRVRDANRHEQFVMHYNMACVYKNQGRYAKAEEHFLNALEKKPNEPDVHYNLGILYDDDLKDPDKAREHYQRFMELAPNDKDAAQVQEWLLSLTK